ncbi:hypothetical protein ASPWEDRAFT_67161 [Aspergillus wentii DTO 134E9]|uniref:Sodium/calcium exchanger membrane region domain-containing protein n=1 Tax=Aspergillus wentii DTO 134E9 TaxID=1073089 RepID=A0A1L9RPQ5_ASPWE|nr:uncharacterized protein ASPWEDRAFT_67161 [Aspergillus wentii DTO 134E9]KAI9924145.1 hypothetical protein MW887_007385 [Aspergillus wentii]OJJ36808.1 hypothetical protein ASPWEDRAFT_67161 [Aspergillus wentii DTO 134E9]
MSGILTSNLSRTSGHRKRRYSARPFYLTILIFTVLTTASWIWGDVGVRSGISLPYQVQRQTGPGAHLLQRNGAPECRLVRNAKDQCSFIHNNCPDHEDGLLSYLQLYYCTLADAKPLAFIIIILWLSLLFSTIGIAASDFLCINLSTLASVLGLSESLTGVTFLAFGNGSPDVFSTFAAMRSNSGSLAIGELIGAASFITSVVAGSMALVRPFRVARRSFVRDVGYFIVAVSFSMVMLADGRLHVWESAAMVGLYGFYVLMVVSWHWHLVRQRRAYERNLAARSHFHIPDNQELDIEEAEDDDPGVATESRSLLRASTEDFENLERSDAPAWKEGEEDEETRNRYLAEIRDNMHVYRPSRRRNTLNPIRPSLVGALEFQSVLSSLQKARNIHQDLEINLNRYSDDPSAPTSRQRDNRSIASHPRTGRTVDDSLSPHLGTGASRVRAVSANDAMGLRLDTSMFNHQAPQRPVLTISRPSGEPENEASTPPQISRIEPDAMLTVSPSSIGFPSRSPSPGTPRLQSSDFLAPPDTFLSPNYQAETSHPRSPLQVSPRGTAPSFSDAALESPLSPFPPFPDVPSPGSSRPPSIRITRSSSITDLLQLHDSVSDGDNRPSAPVKWWPYWLLPTPESLISTLFPTLVGWKTKSIWARLLAVIAAPSVLLLTITLPVVEPAQAESVPNPVPVVIASVEDGGSSVTPRVRLPEDSPLIRALEPESVPEERTLDANNKDHFQPIKGRQRFDSELPPIQPPPAATPSKEWCRWLVSLQLVTGPFFVALIAWTTIDPDLNARNLILPTLCCLLFSILCFGCLMVSTRNRHGSQLPDLWRPFLALLGFMVAIAWIATIATEVVNLLKTLGVILNISDSLLGLTVFAVGNSLGDLVADITVARLGYPVMALSACFGGPMLNILLGIGLGGLYMTMNTTSHGSTGLYEIAISKVLVISGATLLITLVGLLIVIPLNKWRMDRKIGWGLVILWAISTVGNVIAELTT